MISHRTHSFCLQSRGQIIKGMPTRRWESQGHLRVLLPHLPVYIRSPTKSDLTYNIQLVPLRFSAWLVQPPGKEGFTVRHRRNEKLVFTLPQASLL